MVIITMNGVSYEVEECRDTLRCETNRWLNHEERSNLFGRMKHYASSNKPNVKRLEIVTQNQTHVMEIIHYNVREGKFEY